MRFRIFFRCLFTPTGENFISMMVLMTTLTIWSWWCRDYDDVRDHDDVHDCGDDHDDGAHIGQISNCSNNSSRRLSLLLKALISISLVSWSHGVVMTLAWLLCSLIIFKHSSSWNSVISWVRLKNNKWGVLDLIIKKTLQKFFVYNRHFF